MGKDGFVDNAFVVGDSSHNVASILNDFAKTLTQEATVDGIPSHWALSMRFEALANVLGSDGATGIASTTHVKLRGDVF